MERINSQVKTLTSQIYLIKLERDESEPFTIRDGLNIDYDRWLSKNENWIQLKNMDPKLAEKHYETSDLRIHVEKYKTDEDIEFMERWHRKAEVKKKVAEFQVKKAAKRIRYEIVDRPANKK